MSTKVILNKFGDPNVLKLETFELGKLPENKVRVKVLLAGFNPVDSKIRSGKSLVSEKIKTKMPWNVGYDIVAEVIECGQQTTELRVGDIICGMIGFPLDGGGYSTDLFIDPNDVVKVNSNMPLESALLCCLSGLTAFQSYNYIKDSSLPLLILGSTGSVGSSLLHIATTKGKDVITFYRNETGKEVLSSFPTVNAFKSIENLVLHKQKYDLVDLVGGDVCLEFLGKNSNKINKVISVPTYSSEKISNLCHTLSVDFNHFIVKKSQNDLKELIELHQNFPIPSLFFNSYSLDEVAKLHTDYENGNLKGKGYIKME